MDRVHEYGKVIVMRMVAFQDGLRRHYQIHLAMITCQHVCEYKKLCSLLLLLPTQVMDDNKVLTLASNERIALTSSMRLVLEISHMSHCSPATVSRGGVIYVNDKDVGWKPVGVPEQCIVPKRCRE